MKHVLYQTQKQKQKKKLSNKLKLIYGRLEGGAEKDEKQPKLLKRTTRHNLYSKKRQTNKKKLYKIRKL